MLPSENEIIHRYFDGDQTAFTEIVDLYLKQIFNFVYRLVGSEKESEDITQEVFVKVWKNLNKFDTNKNFKTWVFTIARNTCIDFLRKKKDVPISYFDDEEGNNILEDNLVTEELNPDEVFVNKENKEVVENILLKLSTIQKEVVTLRYINEMSFNEISEILNIPLNTIKSHHNRALIKMKSLLSATK